MSEHDDLNWGDDRRIFSRFVRWWQTISQITKMEDWDCTFAPSINVFPPGGFWSFTIPWGEKLVQYWNPAIQEGAKFNTPVYRVVNIRAGWLWVFPVYFGVDWWPLWPTILWPLWVLVPTVVLGVFLNWRRDKNSGEYYWTLSFNIDHESQRW